MRVSQRFLLQVAASALQGRVMGSEKVCLGPAATRLPVDAHALLARIPTGASLDQIADDLKQLVKRTPSVTRLRRVAMLSSLALLPTFLMMFMALGIIMYFQISQQNPEIAELRSCLRYMERRLEGPPDDRTNPQQQKAAHEEREAFEIYIAGTFRDTISDQKT